jgi:hypothetical protein
MPDFQNMSDEDLAAFIRAAMPTQSSAPAAQTAEKPGTLTDVLKSGWQGLKETAATLAGSPMDVSTSRTPFQEMMMSKIDKVLGVDSRLPEGPTPGGSEWLMGKLKDAGLSYDPQTVAGKYTKTVASLLPAAVGRPSGLVRRLVNNVAAPAVLSETAGEMTRGTEYEPYARLAGLLTGNVGASYLNPKPTAGSILRQAAPKLTDQQMRIAQSLMEDAQARGMPLTLPEAIQQVTNSGTRFGDVQRVVEGSSRGGSIMRDFYAGRPTGVDSGVKASLDQIAPPNMSPTETGYRVQKAAEGNLTDIRQRINAAAEPYYNASKNSQIPDQQFAPIAADPVFQEALKAVKADPIRSSQIAGLPDNSIGVIDAVKKQMDTMESAMAGAGDNFGVSLVKQGRRGMLDEADVASPEYSQARFIGQVGRKYLLEPAERSPLGQLAGSEKWQDQAKILLNPNPDPNSELQIAQAVKSVAAKDPGAARDLVRMHLEQTFNAATRKLQSGDNQFGGAKFSAMISGNDQQAKNLKAALESLPNGTTAYRDFRRVLDILEAQGRRQPIGSQTEFNRQIAEELSGGPPVAAAATHAVAPGRLATMAADFWHRFQYGQNTEVLAKLFTSPDAVSKLRAISSLPVDSDQAAAEVGRLLLQVYVTDGGQTPRRLPAGDSSP